MVSFPTIIVPPTNQTVGLGSTVAFVVSAVGQSIVKLSLADERNWFVERGTHQWLLTNSALIISNAQTSDDAGYSVIVTNTLGSVTSSPPAVLTVLTAPSFEGITAESGTNGVFILNGVGGTNNGPYFVLTSTNLSTPLGLWTPVGSQQLQQPGPVCLHQHRADRRGPTVLHPANAIIMPCHSGPRAVSFQLASPEIFVYLFP